MHNFIVNKELQFKISGYGQNYSKLPSECDKWMSGVRFLFK